MKPRRRARIVALQTLYALDCTHQALEEAFAGCLGETPLASDAATFARQLIQSIDQRRSILDEIIQQIAPEWPLDQMALIDHNVLRIGVYEMLMQSEITPLKVAINEAVELAKLFGSDTSSRFVNGALGTLADRYNDFSQQFKSRMLGS